MVWTGSAENKFHLLPRRRRGAGGPYEKELRLFAGAISGSEIGVDLLAPEHAMNALTLSIATQRSLRERCTIELSRTQ